MDKCVFCKKITNGELEKDKVGLCFVFEPLDPVVKGHLLIIHQTHTNNFSDDPIISREVMETAAWVAKHHPVKYKEFNIIISQGKNATQTINHLHVHIIPRKKGDGLKLPWGNGRI